MVAPTMVEHPVPGEEGQRPAQQPGNHRSAPPAERLLGQLEGHGADQHPGAEGHHQADEPMGGTDPQAEHRANEEREPADEPPEPC